MPELLFVGKPAAIQTGSPGMIGGARCRHHLRQVLVFLDAYVLNKPEVMVSQIVPEIDAVSGKLADQPIRDFIATQLKAFTAFFQRK